MLYDNVMADIKSAMVEKNAVKRDCLRSLVSDIKNQSINAGKELTDVVVIKCAQKAVKQHNDSIEQFKAAKRDDLASREIEELEYLKVYLPKMMTAEETRAAVDTILQTVEATKKNMGAIMKQLPREADKKAASQYLNMVLK